MTIRVLIVDKCVFNRVWFDVKNFRIVKEVTRHARRHLGASWEPAVALQVTFLFFLLV